LAHTWRRGAACDPCDEKKHLSHLFDKLGVANRTQAVARARELGLLP
jgi:hypothetical protein